MTQVNTPLRTPAAPNARVPEGPDTPATRGTRPQSIRASAQELAPQASPSSGVATAANAPIDDVQAAVLSLNALLDSFGSMLLAQQRVRSEGVERGVESAEAGEANAAFALERQQEALEAARKAAARANRLLSRAPRWVKKLVAAVITVAGAVAGAFTGGAAAGLAIAGAILILAGDAITKLLVKLGVDEDKAMWAGFAVKVAGTALSLGAGAAGGAVSSANTAVEVVQTATDILNAVTTSVQSSLQSAGAAFEFRAENFRLDAQEAGTAMDVARDEQTDALDILREAETSYQRVLSRMQSWLTTQNETNAALHSHVNP